MESDSIPVHPVQTGFRGGQAPQSVTLRAYEVYSEIYRPQPALVEGECRGGFGSGELVAFLYARSFPKAEWRMRFEEAVRGMKGFSRHAR